MKITLDWQVSPYFGWGVYGLNLALEWAKDSEIEARAGRGACYDGVDALRRRALLPFYLRSVMGEGNADIRIRALGNGMATDEPGGIGAGDVGMVFFEQPLSAAAVERARRYRLIIAGSDFNADALRAAGVGNVQVILQGVDPTLFHPAPRRYWFGDKFLVFSGGKAEPRKGQDIVVKAFRLLARDYPDIMLVTAWHSPWPQLAAGMDLDLSEFGDRVIDVGPVPNAQMPAILRECDVAVFPSRCEGGTNLVAMEAMACGVPTLLSDNSGHRDLLGRGHGTALPSSSFEAAVDGWGDTDPLAVAQAIAQIHDDRASAQRNCALHITLTWARTARLLKSTLEDFHGRSSRGNAAA